MDSFQRYQLAFTDHLRDPAAAPRPKGVATRGMRLYAEIVFNNMESTLAACFPVCRKVLGVRRWKRLVRSFLAGHRCVTPLFRQIPEEFLRWAESRPAVLAELPFFIPSLAHYEWVELAVALAEDRQVAVDPAGDLLTGCPVLTSALMLLEYPCAVHRIAPRRQPQAPDAEPTRLLVYRDATLQVRFIELNAMTLCLLQRLQTGDVTGDAALAFAAATLHHPDPAMLRAFGIDLLNDLQARGVILGAAL